MFNANDMKMKCTFKNYGVFRYFDSAIPMYTCNNDLYITE